jgi:DNA-binding beta-propeller fold protein YncE
MRSHGTSIRLARDFQQTRPFLADTLSTPGKKLYRARKDVKGAISMKLKSTFFLLCMFLVHAVSYAQSPTRIYWTESYPSGTHPVCKANLDGDSPEELCDELYGFTGVAVDHRNGKMYLASRDKIERADLDGSNREELVTSIHPRDIALDLSANKMYWPDYTYSEAVIKRANLDGSSVETLTPHLGNGCDLKGMAIDVSGGKIYWVERMDDVIKRANLNGSGMETILHCYNGVTNTFDVAIYGSKLYWTDASHDSISKADLDGDNVVNDVVTGLNDPRYLEIDPTAGKIYWGSDGDNGIKRANIDGTNIETLVTGVSYPQDVFLAAEPLDVNSVNVMQLLLLD